MSKRVEVGSVGVGWLPLIQEAGEIAKWAKRKVVQVKTKWGGLRYYVDPTPPLDFSFDEAQDALGNVEHKSYQICQGCGQTSQGVGGTCPDCEKNGYHGKVRVFEDGTWEEYTE